MQLMGDSWKREVGSRPETTYPYTNSDLQILQLVKSDLHELEEKDRDMSWLKLIYNR